MSDIATTKDFQQRMFEKIRDQIGDLLTEDDLRKLVSTAMDKAFFKRLPNPQHSSYGYGAGLPSTLPSGFEIMVAEHMKPQIDKAMVLWCNEHSDEIKALIEGVFAKGMLSSAVSWFDQRYGGAVMELTTALQGKGIL